MAALLSVLYRRLALLVQVRVAGLKWPDTVTSLYVQTIIALQIAFVLACKIF